MSRPARVEYEPGWPWDGPWPWCPKAEWTDDDGVVHPAVPHDSHTTNEGNTQCPGVPGLIHEDYCKGGHTDEISCEEVARLRAEHEANPWYCHGRTRSGYHRFGPDPLSPDDACQYEGCDRTWGELLEASHE